MASRIQGITVEIGGDTTKLSKALESVNKSIKGTQSGLKDVNKLLKLDPSNTELVVQKQKMLKDAIEATKEKLATLKTAAQQANEQLANGEITQQQYDALQREIVETEQNLRSLQDQAATTNATLAKISCGTRNQPSRSSGRLSGAAYSSGVSSSSARVRVWNTSTPPSTGCARTYVIQRRPCSADRALPNILIVLPDGGRMVCIAVLLLLIHPVVSHKCGLRFHVAAQPVQRHAAAQPIHQSQRFLCPNRGTWAVALLAEHG